MNVKSRSPCQPFFFDLVMLVRAVVVDDEMNVEVTGHVVLDMAQKLEEFLVAVSSAANRVDSCISRPYHALCRQRKGRWRA